MKYLFTAVENNSPNKKYHKQTKEDVSVTGKGSAYTDIKDKNIKKFWIEGEGHKYGVDLTDGSFEVDGNRFKMHEENMPEYRLVYYRQHQINYTGVKEVDHLVTFCFGWQATKNGKNYKRIMQVT